MADDQQDGTPQNGSDPSVNDVLAQQIGTEYKDVENLDKEELQTELKDQATTAEDFETGVPSAEDATDDRNTSDGQLIGYEKEE